MPSLLSPSTAPILRIQATIQANECRNRSLTKDDWWKVCQTFPWSKYSNNMENPRKVLYRLEKNRSSRRQREHISKVVSNSLSGGDPLIVGTINEILFGRVIDRGPPFAFLRSMCAPWLSMWHRFPRVGSVRGAPRWDAGSGAEWLPIKNAPVHGNI